jgi:hypothetical protein
MAAPNTPRNFAGSVNFDGAKAKEERDYVAEAVEQYRQQLLNPQRQAQPPRGKGKGGGGKNRGFKNEPRALPKSRAVGLVQGKDEPDADFAVRKSQAVPKGARSGKSGGLEEQMFLQEGYTPEAARLKANILRSEGGEAFRAEDGSIQTRGAGQRKEVTSSTGRAYDPIRERQELMQRGREAVAARKEAQAADDLLVKKREDAIRKPGSVGGFATKDGWGERKTLTPEEFAKRKPAMVTEGRNAPVTNKMTEVLGWMDKDQQAAGMPASGFEQRLRGVEDARKRLLSGTRASTGKEMAMAQGKATPMSGSRR